MGKGRGIKATDSACASLCHRCHMEVDQGRTMSRNERVQVWTDAHLKTVAELVRLGLWPKGIPGGGEAFTDDSTLSCRHRTRCLAERLLSGLLLIVLLWVPF